MESPNCFFRLLPTPATWCAVSVAAAAGLSVAVAATPSDTMRAAFPTAQVIAPFSAERVAELATKLLKHTAQPRLGAPSELTPNAPWTSNGSRLSVWKPSFVLGTAQGGEIGLNFWNLYNGGHINVGFDAAQSSATLMDCRVYIDGMVSFKIYVGVAGTLGSEGQSKVNNGHLLLLVPAGFAGGPLSVELWPSPINAVMGLTGCTLWPIAAE